jgi:hypothetical protein
LRVTSSPFLGVELAKHDLVVQDRQDEAEDLRVYRIAVPGPNLKNLGSSPAGP